MQLDLLSLSLVDKHIQQFSFISIWNINHFLQTKLAIPGFHLWNNFLGKNTHKSLQFTTILFPYKKCFAGKRTFKLREWFLLNSKIYGFSFQYPLMNYHGYSRSVNIEIPFFGVFNSPKTNLKIRSFGLVYWGRHFLFVFWENWKCQKVLLKLIYEIVHIIVPVLDPYLSA